MRITVYSSCGCGYGYEKITATATGYTPLTTVLTIHLPNVQTKHFLISNIPSPFNKEILEEKKI